MRNANGDFLSFTQTWESSKNIITPKLVSFPFFMGSRGFEEKA